MFGFKKILKELMEMRKEIEEIKKSQAKPQTPAVVQEQPKKFRTRRRRRCQIDINKIEKKKRYIEDLSVEELAKKMHIEKRVLNNRLNYYKYIGERWANDKKHIYYVDKKGRTRPEKYLSLYAQNKIYELYGDK